jgi:hypothetical protein
MIKLVFVVDHNGYSANEGAAFDLPTAARLVGDQVCVIDPSEPERDALDAAVREYRKPSPNPLWLLPAVSRRGRILMGMFGSKR